MYPIWSEHWDADIERTIRLPFGLGVSLYVWQDEFTTDYTAGNLNGTPTSDGQAKRVVTDTENKVSQSSNTVLFASGKTVPAWGDPGMWFVQPDGSSGWDRLAGRTFTVITQHSGGSDYGVGWDTGATGDLDGIAFSIQAGIQLRNRSGGTPQEKFSTLIAATDYTLKAMMRATGGFFFISGGIWGATPVLVGVDDALTTDPAFAGIPNFDGDPTISAANTRDYAIADYAASVSDTFSDVVAVDSGANALHGTHVKVGLDGTSGQYAGGSYTQLGAAAIAAAGWSGNVGSIIAHITPIAGTVRIFTIGKDTGEYISLYLSASSVRIGRKVGGGTLLTSDATWAGAGVEQVWGGNWDRPTDDELTALINGVPDATPASSLDSFTETPLDTLAVIGGLNPTPSDPFIGTAHNIIYTLGVEISTANHVNIKTKLLAGTLTDADLDTYVGAGLWIWHEYAEQSESDGLVAPVDVVGAGSDVPIISGLGTNDNKGYHTIIPGADVVVNGDFTTSPGGWTLAGGASIGGGVLIFDGSGGANWCYRTPSLAWASNGWFVLTYTMSGYVSGDVDMVLGGTHSSARSANDTYTEVVGPCGTGDLFLISGNNSAETDIDNVSCNPLPLTDLLSLRELSDPEFYFRMAITMADDTQAGAAFCVDSATSPANFALAILDRVDDLCKVYSVVAGVYTLVSTPAFTYSAGTLLEGRPNPEGDTVYVTYNGTLLVEAALVNNAAIIDNTLHGTFATDNATTFEDYQAFTALAAGLA